jgi:hypothetical protein
MQSPSLTMVIELKVIAGRAVTGRLGHYIITNASVRATTTRSLGANTHTNINITIDLNRLDTTRISLSQYGIRDSHSIKSFDV